MYRKRGVTLMEVMIVAALLGLVMTIVGPILAPAGRVMQRVDVDTRAQQTAVVALEKLFQEIGYSDARGVTLQQPLSGNPLALAYPSVQPAGWKGLTALNPAADYDILNLFTTPVTWPKFSILYLEAPLPGKTTSRLLRKDYPYSGAAQLAQIKASRMTALATDARPSAVIASDVKTLTLDHPTSTVIHIDITISQTWDQERITHLQTDVCLRN